MVRSPKKKPALPGAEEKDQQTSLFGDQPAPSSAPAATEDQAHKVIYVHFETWDDYDKFREVLGVNLLPPDTRSVWYPPRRVAS